MAMEEMTPMNINLDILRRTILPGVSFHIWLGEESFAIRFTITNMRLVPLGTGRVTHMQNRQKGLLPGADLHDLHDVIGTGWAFVRKGPYEVTGEERSADIVSRWREGDGEIDGWLASIMRSLIKA